MKSVMGKLAAWNPFWAFLLVFAAAQGYIVASTKFGWFQRVPWLWILLMLVGLAWSVAMVHEKRSIPRILSTVLCVLLIGLFSWWVFDYSEYDHHDDAVLSDAARAELQDLTLVSHAGTPTPVLADQTTLLVLYRGHW